VLAQHSCQDPLSGVASCGGTAAVDASVETAATGNGQFAVTPREDIVRIAAVVCNLLLFAAIGMIVLTEGMPSRAVFLLFTVLALLVPIVSAAVILRRTTGRGWHRSPLDWATGLLNVALIGLTCWAAISQFPPPEGLGVLPFAVLMFAAPILSLTVLVHSPRPKTLAS
jgi:hypothetical protein